MCSFLNTNMPPTNIEIHMRAHIFPKSDATIRVESNGCLIMTVSSKTHKNVPSKKHRFIFIERYFLTVQSDKLRFSLPLMLWPLFCLGITFKCIVKWCV